MSTRIPSTLSGILEQTVWKSAIIFESSGNIVGWNEHVRNNHGQEFLAKSELREELAHNALHLFESFDSASFHGIKYLKTKYEAHQWDTDLCWGREGDAFEGEGIAVMKIYGDFFILITYVYPVVSTLALEKLNALVKELRTSKLL
ncbi:hypothetical protein ADUPG1_007054 [Aduncisulcus paluster]|uniref:Profilin n=1 Tax=Aduncisulcus paluster TaxID=2918883 RepID=A0ABQ5KP13_9EUKA|nr:hypothetical protein ADUPG1_007054 [Aduncisulcus paluster]